MGSTLPLNASPPQQDFTGPQQLAASPVASTRRAASQYLSRTSVVSGESIVDGGDGVVMVESPSTRY